MKLSRSAAGLTFFLLVAAWVVVFRLWYRFGPADGEGRTFWILGIGIGIVLVIALVFVVRTMR